MAYKKMPLWLRGLRSGLVFSLYVLMILVWAFPVIWVILTSLKTRTEIFTLPPTIFF